MCSISPICWVLNCVFKCLKFSEKPHRQDQAMSHLPQEVPEFHSGFDMLATQRGHHSPPSDKGQAILCSWHLQMSCHSFITTKFPKFKPVSLESKCRCVQSQESTNGKHLAIFLINTYLLLLDFMANQTPLYMHEHAITSTTQ